MAGAMLSTVRALSIGADCLASVNVLVPTVVDFAAAKTGAAFVTAVLAASSLCTFGAFRRTEVSSANRRAATCVRRNPAAYTASTAAEPSATRLELPRLLARADTGAAALDFTLARRRSRVESARVHNLLYGVATNVAVICCNRLSGILLLWS